MQLHVSESVAAYAHDPAIEATVDGLINAREKLPPDLRWREMADYYRAWTAAQRVVGDYALALLELWCTVWGPATGDWEEIAPDDQTADDRDADPFPRVCWRNEWLARCHRRGGATLYTCVRIVREQVFLGVGLFGAKGKNLLQRGPKGYELDPDSDLFWQTTSSRIAADGSLDGSELIKGREAAMNSVNEVVSLTAA